MRRNGNGKAFGHVQGERQEFVPGRVAGCRQNVHVLNGRRIRVESNGQRQMLVVHECMEIRKDRRDGVVIDYLCR